MKAQATTMQGCAYELMQLGVARQWAMPPLHRALWRMGIPIRPPLYDDAILSTVVEGIVLAVFWALGMRLIARDSMSTGLIVGSLVFGFLLALFNRWQLVRQRRRMQLPEWDVVLSSTKARRQKAESGPRE